MARALGLLLLLGLVACGPRFVEPTGAVVPPLLSDDRFRAADGVELPVHRWLPATPPRGLVLALHSFGDFGGAFEDLGPFLADRGFLVLAPDQRGFGAAPAFGRWWGAEAMVDDAVTLARLLRAAHPDVPLHIVGESMGGAVALLAAARSDTVDRLVLAAPAVRANLPYRRLWDWGLWAAAVLAPGYTVEAEQADPELRVAAIRRLADDPRVLREVRADTYWGLIQLANAASAVDPDRLPPTFLMFGTADATVPLVSLCTLAARLDEDDAVRIYRDAGHRLLHEPRGLLARRDILAWLEWASPVPVVGDAVLAPGFCADYRSGTTAQGA